MTLNITIISPVGIHQSADFQISKTEKDANGNWIELQPNSSKILSLHYEKWSGFLTYCGMGLWQGKRTDEYAADWLAQISNFEATFEDTVKKIREQGTAWLAGINQSFGKIMAHTFVLAGYEGGVPVYAVVSNYQTLIGDITPISNELKVDLRRSRTDVHVLVTGIRSAVSGSMQRKLKRLAKTGREANVIRYELEETNRQAAQSAAAANGISKACLTFSVDRLGASGGEVHGDVPGPLMPRTVFGGIDTTKMLTQFLKSNPHLKFVQGAASTGQSHDATVGEHIDCQLNFNKARREFDGADLATLEEIGAINDYHLSMNDLNNTACIVGQWRNPVAALPHAFAWPSWGDPLDLGTFGGPFSGASSTNDHFQVVGTAHVDHSATRAFLWEKNEGMRDLGTLGGRDSAAASINNNCQIVGHSFVGSGDPSEEARRAFLWTPENGMINLGIDFEGWSMAVAINNSGVVLGRRLREGVACGFVWSAEIGFVDIVGQSGRAFYPFAINDSGLVIGEGDDSVGKRRPFSWTLQDGLKRLAAPDDFHPCDVDVDGNIIGNVHSRPWNRPYLYSAAMGQFLALPFAEKHGTGVGRINRNGVIVGSAWKLSWKHSHPLVWRLNLNLLSS
jgi:probable HAF family extracellular repeat protein